MGDNPVNYVDPYGLFGLPSLPQGFVNASAGFGDALALGLTALARNGLGIGSVNKCSGAYAGGQVAGIIGGFVDGEGEAQVARIIFKAEHYAPRLEAAGADVERVEFAVADAVRAIRKNMEVGADVRGRMTVDNVLVEYRSRLLSDGTVNVGTVFPVAP